MGLFLSCITTIFTSQHTGSGRYIQVLGKVTHLKNPTSLGLRTNEHRYPMHPLLDVFSEFLTCYI